MVLGTCRSLEVLEPISSDMGLLSVDLFTLVLILCLAPCSLGRLPWMLCCGDVVSCAVPAHLVAAQIIPGYFMSGTGVPLLGSVFFSVQIDALTGHLVFLGLSACLSKVCCVSSLGFVLLLLRKE